MYSSIFWLSQGTGGMFIIGISKTIKQALSITYPHSKESGEKKDK